MNFDPQSQKWIDLDFLNEQVNPPPELPAELIYRASSEWTHAEQAWIAELYTTKSEDPKELLLNRWFDAKAYEDSRPDVAMSSINPGLHYFTQGYREAPVSDSLERESTSGKILRVRANSNTSKTDFNPNSIYQEWHQDPGPEAEVTSALSIAKKIRSHLKSSESQIAISISHDNAYINNGGVQKIIREETDYCKKFGALYVHIAPTKPVPFPLESLKRSSISGATAMISINGQPAGIILQTAIDILARELDAEERVSCFIVHHFFGFSVRSIAPSLQNFAKKGKALWWVHDYSSSCISHTLLLNGLAACGSPGPDSVQCQTCEFGDHRKRYLEELGQLTRIKGIRFVYPSQAALDTSHGGYSVIPENAKETVLPHGRLHTPLINKKTVDTTSRKIRIAYIGYPAIHKGWQEFSALASEPSLSEYYDFIQVGAARGAKNIRFALGDGSKGESCSVESALRENEIDYAFIWPLWAETFCFTAYEAAAAGCHILTNKNSGNISKEMPSEITTVLADIDSCVRYLTGLAQGGFAEISYAKDALLKSSGYTPSLIESLRDQVS